LNYATNYWTGGGNSSKTFMFLADVAMGKYFTPKGPRSDLPLAGYDSTYAIGGQSGVMNNEMIVYKLEQCNLKYLCEFE
jgi:poly [ADP-ribose] polymerase